MRVASAGQCGAMNPTITKEVAKEDKMQVSADTYLCLFARVRAFGGARNKVVTVGVCVCVCVCV